jgi:hypothetical protein
VTKDEEREEADPATQEVEDNDLVVDAVKHEDEKEADPVMQEVDGNDFVVRADPGNTNIVIIAVSKRAEDGTDGNFRQRHASFEVLENDILSRIRHNECKEEN